MRNLIADAHSVRYSSQSALFKFPFVQKFQVRHQPQFPSTEQCFLTLYAPVVVGQREDYGYAYRLA